MWIPLAHLFDRLRQPKTRAFEVRRLREKLRDEDMAQAGPDERACAAELLRLRKLLKAAIGEVQSCRTCAIGHPPPHGHFAGGHCCGLQTEDAFNDDEIAALRLSGSLPRDLRLPRGDHAGCAFRGPTGCSLRVENQPNLCVRYLCPDLFREVYGRGDGAKIEALCDEMEAVYLRFIKLRAARLAADE
ncbi:MAG TPA: hypothetical protein PKL17_19140 [Pseudomonadota bacterium]|nr:hypothetical protein [Pseudomonadota bacterium]